MNNKVFAEFIKHKRKDSGLSQSEVSDQLGYTTSQFVSNWERGISLPPIQTLPILAKMFKSSLSEFTAAYKDQCIMELSYSLTEKLKQIESVEVV